MHLLKSWMKRGTGPLFIFCMDKYQLWQEWSITWCIFYPKLWFFYKLSAMKSRTQTYKITNKAFVTMKSFMSVNITGISVSQIRVAPSKIIFYVLQADNLIRFFFCFVESQEMETDLESITQPVETVTAFILMINILNYYLPHTPDLGDHHSPLWSFLVPHIGDISSTYQWYHTVFIFCCLTWCTFSCSKLSWMIGVPSFSGFILMYRPHVICH